MVVSGIDSLSLAISMRVGDAQRGVEVGQRLVEQEDLGVAHDGAADGDALALAARQRLGQAVEIFGQLQDLGGLRAPAGRSRPWLSLAMLACAKAMLS